MQRKGEAISDAAHLDAVEVEVHPLRAGNSQSVSSQQLADVQQLCMHISSCTRQSLSTYRARLQCAAVMRFSITKPHAHLLAVLEVIDAFVDVALPHLLPQQLHEGLVETFQFNQRVSLSES